MSKFAVGLDAGWQINFFMNLTRLFKMSDFLIWRSEKKAAKHAVFATACRNRFYGEVKQFNPLPNFICMFSRKVVDDF